MLWAQSTAKDYFRSEHKVQCSIYLQVIHSASHYTASLFFSNLSSNSIHNFGMQTRKTITHVLEPVYILRALNTGTCIQQDDLFYSVGLHRNRCLKDITFFFSPVLLLNASHLSSFSSFFEDFSGVFPVLAVTDADFCVDSHNKIGHPARLPRRLMQAGPMLCAPEYK